MRIPLPALTLAFLLMAATLLVALEPTLGFSDGIAGASGAIDENLKKCRGVQYCKVVKEGCGGCHGDRNAMMAQRGSELPVIDRIQLTVKLNGNANAQEYEPGTTYVVDLSIAADRARGPYNQGGFNLNVSGGRLVANDDTVRITGGMFQHAGSKNASTTQNGNVYGDELADEHQWAGEATQTAKGANQRSWRLKWTAPGRVDPHGVAFQVAFMVPDGNGWDNGCVYKINASGGCDSSLGYSDQNGWDWWYFGAPLRIVCEKGQDRDACHANVLNSIRPPPPPLDTCPNRATTCTPASDPGLGGGNGTPFPPALAVYAVLAILAWAARRRA